MKTSPSAQSSKSYIFILAVFALAALLVSGAFSSLISGVEQRAEETDQPVGEEKTGEMSATREEVSPAEAKSDNTEKVLAEGAVREILNDFANTHNFAQMEQGDALLFDVANGKGGDLRSRLDEAEKSLEAEKGEFADAIDARGYTNAATKVCLARSILDQDLKHTCRLSAPADLVVEDIDDLTAVEAVLPAFLNGVAYFEEGNYAQSKAFLDMVVAHRTGGVTRWNDANFPLGDPIYAKIQAETLRILADKDFAA